ncbi:PEP-CTERM sorting domain-containing protein [Cerasicoccus maritimus]|uniref:PEP-CTERM sorting domain-containing protein n=1 Tax=Cerasicoccus maritimus TaxID=490089 RepID=UPI00285292DC|nr:PEP-CTERM sorting domain-containing protein [Cerasicoccus maritimus]
MKKSLTFLALFAACSSLQAAFTISISLNDFFGKYYQNESSGTLTSDYSFSFSTVFDLDTFNSLTEAQKSDFATVSALFSTDASQTTAFGTNTGSSPIPEDNILAQPLNTYTTLAGDSTPTEGDQIYVLVYNSLMNNWGLFTDTNWQVPATNDSIPDNYTINNFSLSTSGTALVGSINGVNGILITAVPEPSTYAFMAGLMTLGLVAYRRRQKA